MAGVMKTGASLRPAISARRLLRRLARGAEIAKAEMLMAADDLAAWEAFHKVFGAVLRAFSRAREVCNFC